MCTIFSACSQDMSVWYGFSGLLKRRVMDCFSCRYQIYICPSPSGQQNCGGISLFVCVYTVHVWLIQNIIQVILMQMSLASLFFLLSLTVDYPVQAEEGGQAVLNCFLPWHRILLEKTEYHYSWAPGVPGTKKVCLQSLSLPERWPQTAWV